MTDVLIAGAGPTGLTLAIELAGASMSRVTLVPGEIHAASPQVAAELALYTTVHAGGSWYDRPHRVRSAPEWQGGDRGNHRPVDTDVLVEAVPGRKGRRP